ncbi:MAG: hypothetical protein U0165_12615 [Polyangiaceae bacterium]
MKTARILSSLALVLLSSLGAGCSGDDDSSSSTPPNTTTDEYAAELFPGTVVLDDATLATMSTDDRSGKLVFSASNPSLAGLKKGSVILAGKSATSPRGLLRVVRSVSTSASGVELDTVDAPLQVAFKKLHVKATRTTGELGSATSIDAPKLPASFEPFPGSSIQSGGGDSVSKKVDVVVFDGDNNETTTDDQVRVQGELGGGFEYELGIDVDWGDIADLPEAVASCVVSVIDGGGCSVQDLLPEVKVGFHLSSSATAKADVVGAAFVGFDKKVDVATLQLDPFAIGILVFSPRSRSLQRSRARRRAKFHVGARADASFKAGVEYSSKTGGDISPPTFDKSFETVADDVVLQANAKAAINGSLALRLYDVAGPKAGLSVYTELTADQNASPCWDLEAGIDLTYGFVLGAELGSLGKVTFAEWSDSANLAKTSVASGACELPADGGPVVPGSGPTTETFSTPKFLPWASAYTGVLRGVEYGDLDGIYRVNLGRSIDGHLTVTSNDSSALLKVSTKGDVVWARSYHDDAIDSSEPPLSILATTHLGDATMLAATYPAGLLKLGQAGGVYWAKALDLPSTDDGGPNGDTTTQRTISALTSDGTGGAWFTATREIEGATRTEALLVHVDVDGNVLGSFSFSDDTRHLYPTVIVVVDDGVVVSGTSWLSGGTPTFEGFALKVSPSGTVAYAKTFAGCADADSIRPAAGLRHSSGDVVLVGNQGDYSRGFALRLSKTGEVVFATNPKSSVSLTDLSFTGVAELPTTGFLVTGRFTDKYEPRDIMVGALDATGNILWAQQYRQSKTPSDISGEQNFPALLLDDDGGAYVAAYSSVPNDSLGSIWMLKVRAKDGSIDFTDASTVTNAPVMNADCALTFADWATPVKPISLALTTRAVTVADVSPTVTTQSP